jgi:hypothetical protein
VPEAVLPLPVVPVALDPPHDPAAVGLLRPGADFINVVSNVSYEEIIYLLILVNDYLNTQCCLILMLFSAWKSCSSIKCVI